MSHQIIDFKTRKKIKQTNQTTDKMTYLQFSRYDLNCIKEALLYLSGIVEPRNQVLEEIERKEFTKSLYTKILAQLDSKIAQFYFSNIELLCLSDALLMYSGFIGSQDEIPGNIETNHSYIIQLYASISSHAYID